MMNSPSLKPAENPTFSFPPFRRRPLRSETYRTMVRIISHCDALQPSQQHPKQRETANQHVNVDFAEKGSGLQDSLARQEAQAVLTQEDVDKTHKEVNCVDPKDIDIGKIDETGDGYDIIRESIHVDSVEVKSALWNLSSVDAERGSCTMVGHKDFIQRTIEELSFVDEDEASMSSSLHLNTVVKVPTPVPLGVESNSRGGMNLFEELKMKEKELEELITNAAEVDSTHLLAVDGDIEEGEISGNGIYKEAIEFLLDDAISSEEKHGCKNENGVSGLHKHDTSCSLPLDTVCNGNVLAEMQSSRIHLDTDMVASSCKDELEIQKVITLDTDPQSRQALEQVGGIGYTDHLTVSVKDLAQKEKIVCKINTEDRDMLMDEKCSIATQDVCAGKEEKKKKRAPLSKEKKAKKKKKERIKRAEKNRKLGVRRLKLKPVLQQKKVTYCRHYLMGRCHEGEKCKFSHDTTPLTKSKPCCHFARHSCMKGDDCPYDHLLSKYPCNNYLTNGFCSRGADCLFSHTMQTKEVSPLATISNAELKSPLQNNNVNSKKQINLLGNSHQQSNTKSNNVMKPTVRNTDRLSAQGPQKPAAVPKGITMISLVGSSSVGKHDKSSTPLKGDGGVHPDQEVSKKLNEMAYRVPERPKGINFLSFGKVHLNGSQMDKDRAIGESVPGDLNKSNALGSSSSTDKADKFGNGRAESSLEIQPSENGTMKASSSASTPQGVKFLTLGKVLEGNSTSFESGQSGLLPENAKKALPLAKTTSGGHNLISDMARGLVCSSNPFCTSLNKSGTIYSGDILGSSKESLLLNTPKTALKALNSTLAFAAKFDSHIKLDCCTTLSSERDNGLPQISESGGGRGL